MAGFRDTSRTSTSSPSDAELAAKVLGAIGDDSRVDQTEVSVRVEGGLVYLTGMVDSAAERRAAQEDVESVVTRDKIIDTLTLRNYVPRTDEELSAAVRHAMKRDIAVDADDVLVESSDGAVILFGHVNSNAQKLAIESIAWWTPGVTDVRSRLQVDGVEEPPDEPDY